MTVGKLHIFLLILCSKLLSFGTEKSEIRNTSDQKFRVNFRIDHSKSLDVGDQTAQESQSEPLSDEERSKRNRPHLLVFTFVAPWKKSTTLLELRKNYITKL